jgi:hypothetical protein
MPPGLNIAACRPGIKNRGEFGNDHRILGSYIFGFGAVGDDVVEFPVPRVLAHQLPIAFAYRAVAFMLPDQRLFPIGLAVEDGSQGVPSSARTSLPL